MIDAVAVGQVARDLVLLVDEVPGAGGSASVRSRREMLGGKGANLAVSLSQLGAEVALLGVVGDDEVGDGLLARARADRVDVTHVVRRQGADSALIVDVVDGGGHWRYLEDVPEDVKLTEADVASAAQLLREARSTVVELQQPSAAILAAARCARDARRFVVLDGAPADDSRREALLDCADVLRADPHESQLLVGSRIGTVDDAVRAGRELLRRHELTLVALAAEDGNAFVWDGGHEAIPLVDTEVVDTTGSGDALTAALTFVLARGGDPRQAARLAVAAAAATVGHPGGRPNLTKQRLDQYLSDLA